MTYPWRHTICACALLFAAWPAAANDFPTVERVLYVQDCVKANPGPYYEMVNKCSCALDTMARAVTFDDYSAMTTIINAVTIGGERGAVLRENETIKPQIKRYRDLQVQVKQACFINPR